MNVKVGRIEATNGDRHYDEDVNVVPELLRHGFSPNPHRRPPAKNGAFRQVFYFVGVPDGI